MLSFDELFKNEPAWTGRRFQLVVEYWLVHHGPSHRVVWATSMWFGMVPPDFCTPYRAVPTTTSRGGARASALCTSPMSASQQGGHHRFITEKAVFANWARDPRHPLPPAGLDPAPRPALMS
ncbi:Alpha-N-acetylgalactosaminide alpha-2,6-sialyltransferase 5 [Merluccius polli]|uniref:Alpha-N-acetylgalactosaminide alpha-2,6-sialyltransferase 5 n=1 Tax=Merluccius polli TaxID=89951 RepID=A0AA47MZP2_MERPO|nr:Alpha-N-acetylgalactosaminide alpha-2,6-sialyltransferase 5 [Merluccius polli]